MRELGGVPLTLLGVVDVDRGTGPSCIVFSCVPVRICPSSDSTDAVWRQSLLRAKGCWFQWHVFGGLAL